MPAPGTARSFSESISIFILCLATTAGCVAFGFRTADYHPEINTAEFQSSVDNRFYPLVPGTVLRYTENDRGEVSEVEVTVTPETRMIMGVKCVVVHDVVSKYGKVAEDTYDWLARHKDGTVWYFGEDTKEISPGGLVSTLGSWEAGIDRGQPGILMPGQPQPGEPYRQEYGPGAAEDMGQVVALNETVTVPAGTFTGCVKTREWSLLESGHESKWYAPDVGLVKEEATGGAVMTLQSITQP